MKKSLFILLSVFLLISCYKNEPDIKQTNNKIEQINKLISDSNNKTHTDSLRNSYLIKAFDHLRFVENDSLKIKLLSKIGNSYMILGNWDAHLRVNKRRQLYAIKYSDTKSLANAQSHIAYNYSSNYLHDSAFYYYKSALKNYLLLKDELSSGRTLLSLGTIQEYKKDYTGSEINTIKAIEILQGSADFKSMYRAYNNLGVLYKKLNQYDLAIENYHKALDYLKKSGDDPILEALTFSNIGNAYADKEKYIISLDHFNRALKMENLLNKDPDTYAMILNNLAYSRFKTGRKDELPDLFFQSLRIRDSLGASNGIVEVNLNLSEYYLHQVDTLKSVFHGEKALKLAKESGYMDGLLRAYLNLSKLVSKEQGNDYLNSYIHYSDSLRVEERRVREKFTRIAYETDEIKQEKEAETEQKNQVILLSAIGAGFSLLLFIIYWQRSKNKQLMLDGERQKANEEVYELMLKQQSKLDYVKEQERSRISEELHDGVLGKLFGARMNLGFLPIKGESETLQKHDELVEELQDIEGEIRTLSHELKKEEFGADQYFVQILEELLNKQSEIGKFQYKITVSDTVDWNEIADTVKINCYRMLQEAIQNINKYAKAENVKVDFTLKNKILKLTIEDNGIGFNSHEVKKGIGIRNFKSRAKKLNGQFELNASPNKGTSLLFKIPV